jgi:formylglycine-generating enzyme required for sulfatase activity
VLASAAAVSGTNAARTRAVVARTLENARALGQSARQTTAEAAEARARALAFFDKDDLGPAEDAWKRMLSLEDDVDQMWRRVQTSLDGVLALDAQQAEARALYADALFEELLAAERLHRAARQRELRARLDLYDDGSRGARLDAASRVRIATDPPGARIVLARYIEDDSRHLFEANQQIVVEGVERELAPGSYLVTADLSGRYTTRYPFLVRRAEQRSIRVVMPEAGHIPPEMVYVPGGRFRYGSGDDEATRGFLTHQPVHDVDLRAFLIARTEVTYREYIDFLRAVPNGERLARMPRFLVEAPASGFSLEVRGGRALAETDAYCSIGAEPCVDWSTLPVGGVTREDGERYVEWLHRTGRVPRARLCTDREWERAARGADERRFPASEAEPGPADACSLATYGGDLANTRPCAPGSHPASRSPFGVDDLEGNEWEWVADSPDVARPKLMIARSGSYVDKGSVVAITNRALLAVTFRSRSYGLRVCADLP